MTKTQQEIDKLLDQMLKTAEKDIDKMFALRMKTILNQIAAMYRKYSKGGELTYTDLNKYQRFDREMAQISEQLTGHYKELLNYLQQFVENTYLEGYLRSAYLYEFEAQALMGYAIPSKDLIKQAVLNPIPKLTLPELMETHRNELVRKISIEIAQGLQAGEDYATMATRIQRVTGFSRKKAKNVARTEGGRVQTQARLDSGEVAQKHAKLDKTWNSTLDSRTRRDHQKLDGQKADEDGYFHIHRYKAKGPHLFGVAKEDCNCRCTILYLVNGRPPEVRRARNYEDPEYQQKIADKMDELMADGMTAKQAEKEAKKKIHPPNLVIPWATYKEWKKERFKNG